LDLMRRHPPSLLLLAASVSAAPAARAVPRRAWWRLSLACALLCVAACDPGFNYRPAGWEKSAGTWVLEAKGFVIEMAAPGGNVAAKYLSTAMTVRNLGNAAIVFDSCNLTTRGRQYRGSVGGRRQELRWRTVGPHATQWIPLTVPFDDALFNVLGESFDLDLRYRLGADSGRSLRIHFVRE